MTGRQSRHRTNAKKPQIPTQDTDDSRAVQAARWLTAAVLLATQWAVDPNAEAAFDAPKRFAWLVGGALVFVLIRWYRPARFDPIPWRAWSAAGRWSVLLAASGAVCILVSTILSPRPEHAWPALRTMLLAALYIPIGASCILDDEWRARLLAVFAVASATNVLLSLLQTMGLSLPLTIVSLGGRLPTGALLGNEGYVALVAALSGAAGLAIAISQASSVAARSVAAVTVLLAIGGIIANHSATGSLGLAFTVIFLVAIRTGRIAAVKAVAAVLIISACFLFSPSMRAVTWDAVLDAAGVDSHADDGRYLTPIERYDRLTTFRLGAWFAAAEMVGDRPLTGYGPGTFAAEFVEHRLAAELRTRVRFLQPTGAFFVQAHQDYLQLAAEAGLPALLLCAGAGLVLLWKLAAAAVSAHGNHTERLVVLAVLSCGAVLALTWFPFQMPGTAVPLLLALGRGWRIVSAESRS